MLSAHTFVLTFTSFPPRPQRAPAPATVRLCVLETSLWKLSAGFGPSCLADIGNSLAGSETLSLPHSPLQTSKHYATVVHETDRTKDQIMYAQWMELLNRRGRGTPDRPINVDQLSNAASPILLD